MTAPQEWATYSLDLVTQGLELSKAWLLSPAAWGQFVVLIVAYFSALLISRRLIPIIRRIVAPDPKATSVFAQIRAFIVMLLPLLASGIAYVLAMVGEPIAHSTFGASEVVAFGKGVFLFLVVRTFVRDILRDPILRLVGKFIFIPIAAINALGLLDTFSDYLRNTVVPLGNLSFDLLWAVKFVAFASVIFWMGRWSNQQSNDYIHKQQEMRPATRQLASKAAELAIFGVAFLVLMNIMGISLDSLTIISGAIGVGLGFGLQKIASNYVSGIILLLEGQATVGDYVMLDGGEAGTIVKMTARAVFLETFDGRWYVVPNEDFITTRVVNYSDQGSANRYEAEFSVSYDTDINAIPKIVEDAVSKHPEILQKPYPPDCELRGFGDSGINFAVEFWVNGIDDGAKKYTSQVLFIIWNALKEHNIEIPYPQRVLHVKGDTKIG